MVDHIVDRLGKWQAKIRAIAQTGLAFTQTAYERERYEELLKLAAEMEKMLSEGINIDEGHIQKLMDDWKAELQQGISGYVTPKLVINSAIFDQQERLLLIQRADKGTWFLPGGWADVGYTPSQIAVKETLEETGLVVKPTGLIAVLDGFRNGFARTVPFYCLVYDCSYLGGKLSPLPHECSDAKFFAENELPQPLHGDGRWAQLIFALHRRELPIPYSD